MRRAASARRPATTAAIVAVLAAILGGCGEDLSLPGATPSASPDGRAPAGEAAPDVARDACGDAELVPGEDNLARVERATLCLINRERGERGRPPLADDDPLSRAARRKARDMVHNGYFAHVGPDGRDLRDWVGATDYLDGALSYRLGENLGWASEGAATPARLVDGWMNSESHRRNLLRRDFEDSGIGVALGDPGTTGGGATYVHLLGTR